MLISVCQHPSGRGRQRFPEKGKQLEGEPGGPWQRVLAALGEAGYPSPAPLDGAARRAELPPAGGTGPGGGDGGGGECAPPSAHAALPRPALGLGCRVPLTLKGSVPLDNHKEANVPLSALEHGSFLGLLAGLAFLSAAKPLSTGRGPARLQAPGG